MSGKIALEEHFELPEYNEVQRHLSRQNWREVERRILDFTDLRLPGMDECGIEYAVVSLTSPGVQGETDVKEAVSRAQRSNDALAAAVAAHPDRLGGFGAVPLQDVEEAIEETRRAILDLGFHGILVNSWTDLPGGGVGRLDEARFAPFWDTLAELGAPLYLHPRLMPADQRAVVRDRPELAGPVWEFGVGTSAAALRLIVSGLLDRHPSLQIVLGHLGEALPYDIWRSENKLRMASTQPNLRHSLKTYLTRNFHVTTSGHFCSHSLHAALAVMGEDRVMFSVDYPYDEMPQGAEWFDGLEMPAGLHRRIGRDNAVQLLSLHGQLTL